jgi:hypothetical protein
MEDLKATGENGTPTVLVNGEVVPALGDPDWVSRLNGEAAASTSAPAEAPASEEPAPEQPSPTN